MRTRFTDFLFSHRSNKNIGLVLGPVLFLAILLVPTPQDMESITEIEKPSIIINSDSIRYDGLDGNLVDNRMCAFGSYGTFGTIYFCNKWNTFSAASSLYLLRSDNLDIYIRIYTSCSFQRWGLDKRIAYFFAMLYKGNNPQIAVLFIICLPTFLLTMTGSITASAAIVFPVVIAFINILNMSSENCNTKNGKNTVMVRRKTTKFPYQDKIK